MKFQIENIEIQNNNMMNPMMQMNQIGDQLLILSLQMINTGIQSFNIGKNISINLDKYIDQLKTISEQINNLINTENIKKQQIMIQMQLMHQQEMMMQQQMMAQQQMFQNLEQTQKRVNMIFNSNIKNGICLSVEPDMTIKELCNKYDERMRNLGYKNNNYYILYDACKIEKNNQAKIKDYFRLETNNQFILTVIFL